MQHGNLAKCPFCGSRADIRLATDMDTGRESYFVICGTCGASVFFEGIEAAKNDAADAETRLQVAEAWNQRASGDLMSCPFCGGAVNFEYYEAEDEYEMPSYDIVCPHCNTYTNFWEHIGEGEDVKAETMRLWTARSKEA